MKKIFTILIGIIAAIAVIIFYYILLTCDFMKSLVYNPDWPITSWMQELSVDR